MFFGKKKTSESSGVKSLEERFDPSFDKIWKKAASSYKADNMQALDSFCDKNKAPWYAYFLLAAAYDCGACGLPFDMGKAERYYALAEQGVKGSGEVESWKKNTKIGSFFDIFMEYRYYEPGNVLVDLSPQTRQIRRTGLAAVGTYIAPVYKHYNKTVEQGDTIESLVEARFGVEKQGKEMIYTPPINWYRFFSSIPYQDKLFGKNSTQDIELKHTIQPLVDYFLSYTSSINKFQDNVKEIKRIQKEMKSLNNKMKDSSAETMVSDLGEDVYDDFKYLIIGKAMELAQSCPFDYVELAALNPPFLAYRFAWSLLNCAVRLGSVAAVSDLSMFLRTEYWSDQFKEFINGTDKDPNLTASQRLGRELLRRFNASLVFATYTGKQHAFKDTGAATDFCLQYFAPFADHDTICDLMNESGWTLELFANEIEKNSNNIGSF